MIGKNNSAKIMIGKNHFLQKWQKSGKRNNARILRPSSTINNYCEKSYYLDKSRNGFQKPQTSFQFLFFVPAILCFLWLDLALNAVKIFELTCVPRLTKIQTVINHREMWMVIWNYWNMVSFSFLSLLTWELGTNSWLWDLCFWNWELNFLECIVAAGNQESLTQARLSTHWHCHYSQDLESRI